jgi:F420-dependent oxidoreductase-like protein
MQLATEISQLQHRFEIPVEKLKLVDRLGYDLVFTSENTGSDVFTPLGYVLACTERIGVGASLAVTAARSPACTASSFLTLSHIGKGRTVLAGIGNSSPTRAEGWHGRPWGRAQARLRDYVAIMRKVFAGDFPLSYEGAALSQPYAGPDATGAQPMSGLMEPRPDIPILLGTGAPKMVRMTAEIADGWLSLGFAPGMMNTYRPMLEEGFARSAKPKSLETFQIWSHVDVAVSDDVKAAMRPFKLFTARMVGGFKQLGKDVYKDQMVWRGYPEAAERVQELFLAGREDEAADAVPDDYIDGGWLVGPIPRIAERARRWVGAGPTGLVIRCDNLDVFAPIKKAVDGG